MEMMSIFTSFLILFIVFQIFYNGKLLFYVKNVFLKACSKEFSITDSALDR